MDNFGLSIVFLIGTALATISVVTAETCNACNCQLANADRLSQVVELEMDRTLKDEPRKLQLSHNYNNYY